MARHLSPLLRSLSSDLDTISHDMRGLLHGGHLPSSSGYALTLFPKVNLSSDQNSHLLEVFLPGVERASLDVNLEGSHVSISGNRELNLPEESQILVNERFQGRFRRLLTLPADSDLDTLTAKLTDGVLRISVQRKRAQKTQIKIA